MEQPSVAVVVVNYNGLELLKNCLKSLERTTYANFQVIVVDNASTDGSTDFVQKHCQRSVRLVQNERNLGFCAANNIALRQTDTKYVVLLNNDTEVEPAWLVELVRVAEADPTIGALQPKIRSLRNREQFEYGGAAGGLIDVYGYPFCRGRVFNTVERDQGQYDTVMDAFIAMGAAMFLRRSVLDETGLFDESYFAFFEETDLSWRIRLRGYKIRCIPSSVIYHVGGATAPYNEPRRAYLLHRNGLITLLANYSLGNLLRFLPLRLLFEFANIFYYLGRAPKCALAPPRSLLWIIAHPQTVWAKRRRAQRLRKLSDRDILRNMATRSILIQYFLHGKKTFSELKGLPTLHADENVSRPVVHKG